MAETVTQTDEERAAWRAAYHIAWVGASNPRGVARSIEQHTAAVGADHITVRLMRGHLDFLNGIGLGPELDDLDELSAYVKRKGLT